MNGAAQGFVVLDIVLGVIMLMATGIWGLTELDENNSDPIKTFLLTLAGSLFIASGIILSYLVK